jgi:hypothetical protein
VSRLSLVAALLLTGCIRLGFGPDERNDSEVPVATYQQPDSGAKVTPVFYRPPTTAQDGAACRTVSLTAVTTFPDGMNYPDSEKLQPPLEFAIPKHLPATAGKTLAHWAHLALHDSDRGWVTCCYQGNKYVTGTDAAGEKLVKNKYFLFMRCEAGSTAVCHDKGATVPIKWGEHRIADEVVLTVMSGDKNEPLIEVSVELVDSSCVTALPR